MLHAVTEVPRGSGKVLGVQSEVEAGTKRMISVLKEIIKKNSPSLLASARQERLARGVRNLTSTTQYIHIHLFQTIVNLLFFYRLLTRLFNSTVTALSPPHISVFSIDAPGRGALGPLGCNSARVHTGAVMYN